MKQQISRGGEPGGLSSGPSWLWTTVWPQASLCISGLHRLHSMFFLGFTAPVQSHFLSQGPERFLPLPTVTQPLRHPGQGSNAGLTPLRNELMEPKDGLRERKGSQGNPGHPPPLDSVFPIPAWPHKAPEAPGCCHPTCFLKQISISSDMPLIFSARPFLPHGPSGDISATQSC